MQLEKLRKGFLFDCQVRELSGKTVSNYGKQTDYFVAFLKNECGITEFFYSSNDTSRCDKLHRCFINIGEIFEFLISKIDSLMI